MSERASERASEHIYNSMMMVMEKRKRPQNRKPMAASHDMPGYSGPILSPGPHRRDNQKANHDSGLTA